MNEITLFVNGLAANKIYTIQIAAVNKIGRGPFSSPLELEINPISFLNPNDVTVPGDGYSGVGNDEAAQMTWIIAVVSAFTLVLVAISIFFCCKKKLNSQKT